MLIRDRGSLIAHLLPVLPPTFSEFESRSRFTRVFVPLRKIRRRTSFGCSILALIGLGAVRSSSLVRGRSSHPSGVEVSAVAQQIGLAQGRVISR